MNNILVIYNKENTDFMKSRKYIILLSFILVLVSFFILISVNRVIVNARSYGNIDYNFLKTFINISYNIILTIAVSFCVLFNYKSINKDYHNLRIENLLNTRIKFSDIVIGKYLNSIKYTFSLIIPVFPIFYLSFLFGGLHFDFVIRFLLLLFSSIVFVSAVVLYISSRQREIIVSLIFSIIFAGLFLLLNFVFNYGIYKNFNAFGVLVVTMLILSFIFIIFTINSKIYK